MLQFLNQCIFKLPERKNYINFFQIFWGKKNCTWKKNTKTGNDFTSPLSGTHVMLENKLSLAILSWFGCVSSDGSTESGVRHKLMKLKNSQLTCARSVKSWQTLREYIRISPTYCEWGQRIWWSSCFSGLVRSTKTCNKSFCVANILKEIH